MPTTSRIILEIYDLRLTGEGTLPILLVAGIAALAVLFLILEIRRRS